MSAQFVGHHATGAHTADSPRHHSFTSSVSSLFNHDRDPTLTDEQEGDDVFPDRRVHRSDLVEERPEEDLPESAYRVVPAVSDGTREVAAGQQALKPVPSLDISDSTLSLGSRTSSQLRFQSAGKKITVARILTNQGDWQGAIRPPGIDPRRVDMPDLKANCVIQAVDCSKAAVEFSVLNNTDLPGFLSKPRPEWAKVRWLHVNGLSWDVIKALALHYELHPLSLEDMLHHGSASSVRSKADYFRQHLFVSLVVHKAISAINQEPDAPGSEKSSGQAKQVARDQQSHRFGFHISHRDEESIVESRDESEGSPGYGSGSTTPAHPRSYGHYTRKLRQAFKRVASSSEANKRTLSHNTTGLSNRLKAVKGSKAYRQSVNERAAARWTVAELTKDVKVHIHVEQLTIFVLRGGTVLSFTQDEGYHAQFSSVFDRISSSDDLIRESEDPSMILQALLDVVADDCLEIVDEFREQLTRLESRVLSRPDMSDVRHLHILSSQLLLLKSTFSPLQLLIQAIRTQDDAKAAAAIKPSPDAPQMKRMGFVSHEAKVYLGDVMDHVDSVLSSLDLFGDLAENLIAYTFNSLSYSSNSYMQALSVLSVIFLPLTFLSGYFGMNFERFPHVLDGDVSYFWKIAIPVAICTVMLFSYTYLVEMAQSIRRTALRLYHRNLIERRSKEE